MMDQIPFSGATREIVISVVIVLFSFIVAKIVDFLLGWTARHLTTRTRTELDDAVIAAIRKPVIHAIVLLGLYIAAHRLALDPEVKASSLKIVDRVLYILAVVVAASILWRIADALILWYTHEVALRTNTRLDKKFAPLLGRMVKTLLLIIVVIIILDKFGVNVNSIIVSLGVGSLAVALAAKDTAANIIAGITIMVDRPFRIGDRIELSSGEIGDVHDIGFRSTRILTFENTLIIVPNALIINEKLTNLSYPDRGIRVRVDVNVAIKTDVEKAKEIMLEISRSHTDVLAEPAPSCWFTELGDSSLRLSLFCRVADYDQQWAVGEELRRTVKRRFEAEGIEIALPQRVVHLKKDSGQ